MAQEAFLRGPVVVGRDRQDGRRTRLGCSLGEIDRRTSVVRASPRDHGHIDRISDDADKFDLFGVGERGALAGGARHDQAFVAVVDQPLGELGGTVEVERSVAVERGDHRRDHATKTRHGYSSGAIVQGAAEVRA